jgi:hypothetical protein
MNRPRILGFLAVATAFGLAAGAFIDKLSADDYLHFRFQPDSLVLSRSVYVGTAGTVTIGETLPLGCVGGPNGSSNVTVPTTTAGQSVVVNVPCGVASDNGESPNLND